MTSHTITTVRAARRTFAYCLIAAIALLSGSAAFAQDATAILGAVGTGTGTPIDTPVLGSPGNPAPGGINPDAYPVRPVPSWPNSNTPSASGFPNGETIAVSTLDTDYPSSIPFYWVQSTDFLFAQTWIKIWTYPQGELIYHEPVAYGEGNTLNDSGFYVPQPGSDQWWYWNWGSVYGGSASGNNSTNKYYGIAAPWYDYGWWVPSSVILPTYPDNPNWAFYYSYGYGIQYYTYTITSFSCPANNYYNDGGTGQYPESGSASGWFAITTPPPYIIEGRG